nr:scavenger receptor cysteine-rich type 1 protein M130-like isoform X2 [Anas platyrhynchos]
MGTEGLLSPWVLWLFLWVQPCRGAAEVRLVDGGSRCAGRVEVKHQGQWGTVCDDYWDKSDAAVVCRQLGCGVALEAHWNAHFGPGSGPIWMDEVQCNGKESALSDCTHRGWGQTDCYHREDAGVTCSGFVRLVGGDSPCSGSVEVYDRDQWKAVCHSHFGAKAAEVVCRELQCGTALSVHGAAQLGEGAGPVWDRELQCVGNESVLSFCPTEAPKDKACTHSNGTHVTCTQYTGLRLVNGSTACEGRVEVEVLGTWGTLCASRWDLSDAHVLCRHLGCGFAESIPGGGHFGRGTGPVWRDSFHCDGTEAHLGQCLVTALGASPCSQENAAAVNCSGLTHPMPLRLVGGGSRCDGRVEVFQHGTWGRVLDEQWDMQEASVVCRQLQCGEAEAAYTPVRAERGRGPVGLRGVRCAGHEADLSLCNTSLPESTPTAGIMEDVGVVCRGSRRVRLVDGAGRCAGRVEIYYQGRWGTVCDDAWDLADAAVVCRQLGCGGALEAAGSARFGEGSGQIWLDGINCSGAEAALWDCPAEAWGQHDCRHKEDAGVICSEFTALRLENSDGCSGRLQVFYNGTWGSVCSNSMTTETVSLVCKELGCGNEGELETDSNYAKLSGTAWLDHVECGKSSSSFWQCPSASWDPQSCTDSRDEANITCNERPQVAACPNSTSCTDREKIRAVGGKDGCSGRVEIWHRGTWGTLCDNAWDMRDAEVACRQLGCGPALYALGQAAAGEGTGPMWLMECRGTELSLQDCWAQPGDSGACQHKADAAVHCSGRLPGATAPASQPSSPSAPLQMHPGQQHPPHKQIPHGAVRPPPERDSQCLLSSASSWGPSSACSWPSWLGRCEAPGLGAEAPGELGRPSLRPCTRRSLTAWRGRSRRGSVSQMSLSCPEVTQQMAMMMLGRFLTLGRILSLGRGTGKCPGHQRKEMGPGMQPQGEACTPGEVLRSMELRDTPRHLSWGPRAMTMLKRCLWHIPMRTPRM